MILDVSEMIPGNSSVWRVRLRAPYYADIMIVAPTMEAALARVHSEYEAKGMKAVISSIDREEFDVAIVDKEGAK